MIYLLAFLIGGAICGLGQLIKDLCKLTTGHITTLFVALGVLLDTNDFYDNLIDISGAGAILPITSFGHSLAHASYERALKDGFIGIFTGIYDKTAGGIALVLILSLLVGLIFKPKK